MSFSMMFAGHHTTSGHCRPGRSSSCCATPTRWQLSLRSSTSSMPTVRRELPGAARDPAARVGDQGGTEAAPATHPAAARRQRGPRCRGYAVRAGDLWGRTPRSRTGCPPTSRSLTPSSPRAISNHAARTTSTRGPGSRSVAAGHRCVGAAFAMMQLKAIFSVLLRRFTFELAQPSETYRNDHSKMVVQLEQPCVVRSRRGGATRESARRPRSVPGPRRVHGGGARRLRAAGWRRAGAAPSSRLCRPTAALPLRPPCAFAPTHALALEED